MKDNSHNQRVDWVDVTKGLTIILVVTMHSTLGVQVQLDSVGFMDVVVQFGKAHRMPVFFVVAGLFLSRSMVKPWRQYIDKKVLHFAYFYVLWSCIQIGVKAASGAGQHGVGWEQILLIPFEPFGTIWFIYILPFYFVVTRLLNHGPGWFMIAVGIALFLPAVHTEIYAIDLFCHYYIYFVIGYLCSDHIFKLAAFARKRVLPTLALMLFFAMLNILAMKAGVQVFPAFALPLGLIGMVAIISMCAVLSDTPVGELLRFCGQRSLYIYVAFFLPMGVSRMVLIKSGLIANSDLISVAVLISTVCSTLVMYYSARRLGLSFLYERPALFRLGDNDYSGKRE